MAEKDMNIEAEKEEKELEKDPAPEALEGIENGEKSEDKVDSKADEAAKAAETTEAPEAEEAKDADMAETASKEETEADDESKDDKNEESRDPRDRQIEELNSKYLRLFAEFDNYRKRTEQEKAGMYNEGERYVLTKLLSVVDNFERALKVVPEELKGSSYEEGIEKIYRSFMDLLTELGVTPIEACGKEFDANLHNAVMHVEDEEAGENVIIEEFQRGYMFKDKVLRYSMVKVAN